MRTKCSAEIRLLKTLCNGHWGPRSAGIVPFLVRNDAAFSRLGQIIAECHWTNPFPFLIQMHAEASAQRNAKAACEAIDALLNRELRNER